MLKRCVKIDFHRELTTSILHFNIEPCFFFGKLGIKKKSKRENEVGT